AGREAPEAVMVEHAPVGIESFPGYREGMFVVMDQAAQAAVHWLVEAARKAAVRPRLLLDLCAAPGGKTALLARGFPGARIVSVEANARRLPRMRDNLARLRLTRVQPMLADAARLPLPDACADAILLDAPCSASGVLRRHPDAKLLHGPQDVATLAEGQRRMLAEAWRVLAPGGLLLYAVCSILPEEGEQVVQRQPGLIGTRIMPPTEERDGFFIAVFRK
ncbi:MAG: methyltransferase domain-containing protein, partial [Mariprofundaceae bacterium]